MAIILRVALLAVVAASLSGCIEVVASKLNTGPTSSAPAGCRRVSPPVNNLNFVCAPRPARYSETVTAKY